MEVFTISGAAFGTSAYDRARAGGGAASSSASSGTPAMQLQNALKALGTTTGDPTLSNVSVDGVIGPATVKALNYALATKIGAGPVSPGVTRFDPRFSRAQATKADVQNNAAALAQIVAAAVQRAGGTVPPVSAVSHSSHASSARTAAASDQATTQDPSTSHPNLPWIIGGAALVVVALGFMVSRRSAA